MNPPRNDGQPKASAVYHWNETFPPVFHAGRYKKLHKIAVLATTKTLPYESHHFDYSGIRNIDDWFEYVELHQIKLQQQEEAKESKQRLQPTKKKPKPAPPAKINPRTIIPGIQIREHYHLREARLEFDEDGEDYYAEVNPVESIRHQRFLLQFVHIIVQKMVFQQQQPPTSLLLRPLPQLLPPQQEQEPHDDEDVPLTSTGPPPPPIAAEAGTPGLDGDSFFSFLGFFRSLLPWCHM